MENNEQPNNETFFNDLKDSASLYIEQKIELGKLTSIDKGSKLGAKFISGLILGVLAFFAMLFISLMLAYYFSHLYQSYFVGFGLIAGIYFVLFMVVLLARKQLIEKPIINSIIKTIFEGESSHEK
jgi:lipopolysaccharide export LptBFGC system permease protein LptF